VSIPEKKIINHAPFSTKDIDAMALQHPQVLHGTLDNSSILAPSVWNVVRCLLLLMT
jgi:hypothetical protein